MRILISGYYGFDNAGDEAVLYAILSHLKECVPQAEVTVLSNQPEKTAAEYDVRAVDRWGKVSLLKEIKKSDLLISGGGSLLQDITSKNGILYYLGIMKFAQLFHKKVMIYAQGIGPVQDSRNRSLVKKILNKADAITVRDFNSRQELLTMGIYREIMVCADPVLGIRPEDVPMEPGSAFLRQIIKTAAHAPILMVAVRPWKNDEEPFEQLAVVCDQYMLKGWQVVFIPFHYPEDVEACSRVAAYMQQTPVVLEGNYTPLETLSLLKQADMVLAMRLHGLIMGAALQKPIIALSYDPKVRSFMQLLRLKQCFDVESVKAEQLMDALNHTWTERENIKETLAVHTEILAQQAKAPAQMVKNLLN